MAVAAPVKVDPKFTASEMRILKALKRANGEMTYDQIAEKLGKTPGTVKQDISKIRSKYAKFKDNKATIHDEVSKGGMGIPDVVKQGGRGAPRSNAISLDDALAQLTDLGDEDEDEAEQAA
jgi:DNA-binding CsgD family transcriptional regulator